MTWVDPEGANWRCGNKFEERSRTNKENNSNRYRKLRITFVGDQIKKAEDVRPQLLKSLPFLHLGLTKML